MFARLLANRTASRYGRPVSKIRTMPPPVGGWNTRDPLPAMAEEDAITLDNLIPGANKVTGRYGYTTWKTGLPSYPESLMVYAPPNTSSQKMFAATPAAVYDVTSAGVVGAAETMTTPTNGRWQHTMFATSGGTFLWMCNGTDNPRYYNGTAWTVLVGGTDITGSGMTAGVAQSFINVCSHQNRLWLIPENSQDVWYLGVSSITGAATKFPLGALLTRGSKLLAMGSWTKDGGDGMDDAAVFISSAGEVLVYEGTDPSSSATWSLAGRFTIPVPVGRRCLTKAGGDLAVITANGVILLSKILASGDAQKVGTAISDKISGAFQQAYTNASTSHGWSLTEYPREQLLIVNVPIAERVTAYQFVCNLQTGAWCRFTDLDVGAWAVMGDRLFMAGHNGTISRYGDEYTDNTVPIETRYQSAYSTFKVPTVKVVAGARPVVQAPNGYTPRLQILTDYDSSPPTIAAAAAVVTGSSWDTSPWDVSDWSTSAVARAKWQTVHGDGIAISVAMASSLAEEFTLNTIDLLFEQGTGI